MINGKYYKGFKGEIDVDNFYVSDGNEHIGYKLWEGYFENILSGAYYEDYKDDGLLKNYVLHEGWYDEAPWSLENILTAIEELNQYDESRIELELKDIFPVLREIVKKLIMLFEECKNQKKDIYIDYDN